VVYEAGATDGADVGRSLAVEDGGETGDGPFGDVFVDDVCLRKAGLRPDKAGWGVGDFDGNGTAVEDGGVFDEFAGEGVAVFAKVGGGEEEDGFGGGGGGGGRSGGGGGTGSGGGGGGR
jgi:hypothetical protein